MGAAAGAHSRGRDRAAPGGGGGVVLPSRASHSGRRASRYRGNFLYGVCIGFSLFQTWESVECKPLPPIYFMGLILGTVARILTVKFISL